jgi:hypothetical protein
MSNTILIIIGFILLSLFTLQGVRDLRTDPEELETIDGRQPRQEVQEPPAVDREKLEEIAKNCLYASGCRFDLWTYCRNKSNIELMEIIKDYNLND